MERVEGKLPSRARAVMLASEDSNLRYGLEKSCLLIKVRVSKKATHKEWSIQNRKVHFIRYPVPVI